MGIGAHVERLILSYLKNKNLITWIYNFKHEIKSDQHWPQVALSRMAFGRSRLSTLFLRRNKGSIPSEANKDIRYTARCAFGRRERRCSSGIFGGSNT